MFKSFRNITNLKEDFWLHRYSNANFLEKMFEGGVLNLKFTKAINFEDPLEGWDLRNPQIKEAMDSTVNFYNRVINDGGIVENLSEIFQTLNYDKLKLEDLKSMILRLKNYNEKRNSTFISCWFKTDTLEEENRAMWSLYGNKEDGIRISVKWSDLKKSLLKIDEKFEVGFVNYGVNSEEQNLFFTKHISYKHENEFRILCYKENTIENQFIKMDNLKVHTTFRSKHSKKCYVNRLKKNGFVKGINNNNNLTFDESLLFYENKQVDWSFVLGIINREISRK